MRRLGITSQKMQIALTNVGLIIICHLCAVLLQAITVKHFLSIIILFCPGVLSSPRDIDIINYEIACMSGWSSVVINVPLNASTLRRCCHYYYCYYYIITI